MNGTIFLSDLVILPDELILCGDLNLYLDVPSNNNTIKILQSLDACGLIHHVKEPTHYQGHTSDVIITRGYIYIFIRTYFLQSSTQKMQLYTNKIYEKIIIL